MFLEAIFFRIRENLDIGYHWPTKFLIVFLPIIIQNYDV